MTNRAILGQYQVLDLTNETDLFCGSIFADLGATVILIEPPQGHPARNIGPFFKNVPGQDSSLPFFANNANKKSITLDIQTAKGQEIIRRLAQRVDFVLESFSPGYLDRLGLGFETLSKINPRLIVVSITPYGQTGPYSGYKAADICLWGMGGAMFDTGDADRPPLRVSADIAYLYGGIHGVFGALLALHGMQRDGIGRHVDISVQASVVRTLMNSLPAWDFDQIMLRRMGPLRDRRPLRQREVWKCKDGYVVYRLMGGPSGTNQLRSLLGMMKKEGQVDHIDDLLAKLGGLDLSKMNQEEYSPIEECLSAYFLKHTPEDLYRGAIEAGIPLCSAHSLEDVWNDKQLRSRGFWVELEGAQVNDRVVCPGHLWLSNVTDSGVSRRPPKLGEHNQEIYSKIGLTDANLMALKKEGVL